MSHPERVWFALKRLDHGFPSPQCPGCFGSSILGLEGAEAAGIERDHIVFNGRFGAVYLAVVKDLLNSAAGFRFGHPFSSLGPLLKGRAMKGARLT